MLSPSAGSIDEGSFLLDGTRSACFLRPAPVHSLLSSSQRGGGREEVGALSPHCTDGKLRLPERKAVTQGYAAGAHLPVNLRLTREEKKRRWVTLLPGGGF